MFSYDIFSGKASGAFPGVSGKFREASGGPKSELEVTHFSPLVKIEV
jgi:hypothetical protein